MKPNRINLLSRRARQIAALATVFVATQCLCDAATFNLNPLADALVTTGTGGAFSANNFGGAGALAIAAPGLPKGDFQSVLQFDLAGARSSFDAQFGAGQWTLQSVTLQLTSANNNNPAFFNTTAAGQFGVSLLRNNSWLEGTGNPATPATDGVSHDTLLSTFIDNVNDQALGTFSFGGGSSGANSYALSLSSGLLADVLAGDHLSLRLFATDNGVSYLVNSRSVAASANRPTLIISVVPEPRALALGFVGLAVFVMRRIYRVRQAE